MTDKSASKNHCSSPFSFWVAIKAGFLATLVLTVVMLLLGQNSMMYLGKLLVEAKAETYMIYLAGGLLHFGIGIIYGLLYALIFAPIPFSPLIRTFIFSVIITAISFYASPKLPEVIASIKGEKPTMQAQEQAPTPSTEVQNTSNPVDVDQNPSAPSSTPMIKKAIIMSWINHFIFALVLGMIYRRRRVC